MSGMSELIARLMMKSIIISIEKEGKTIAFDEAWAYQRGQVHGAMKALSAIIDTADGEGNTDVEIAGQAVIALIEKIEPGKTITREEYYAK